MRGIASRNTTLLQLRISTKRTKMKESYSGPLSLNTAPNSPFWMVSFRTPDGTQCHRSTKVPVKGGLYMGEKLSAAQAKKEP